MKVLIDTNVVIDSLQSREGFLEDAGEILLRACDYDGYISASSITDIFYLQHRFYHNNDLAKEKLRDLLEIFNVLSTTGEDCRNALRSETVDFEDAVLVESALRNGVEVIVTRNKKDFKTRLLSILTPREFLEKLEGITP